MILTVKMLELGVNPVSRSLFWPVLLLTKTTLQYITSI